MPPRKRGNEQAPVMEGPSQKKKWKPPDEPKYIAIHLNEKTRTVLSLKNGEILMIGDHTYLANIANRSSYIYDIVARVCDCPVKAVKLYRQSDGQLRDEKDQGWRVVGPNAELKWGDYLCECKEGLILSITYSH
jgi:hypothetical protein